MRMQGLMASGNYARVFRVEVIHAKRASKGPGGFIAWGIYARVFRKAPTVQVAPSRSMRLKSRIIFFSTSVLAAIAQIAT